MVRNLVFEGGGVKGIAYGGALKMLKKYGFLSHIEKVAGTSAGAITAVLLSIGYTVEELSKIISETNLNWLKSFPAFRNFNNINIKSPHI